MYDQTSMKVVGYHFSMLQDATRVTQFQAALAAAIRPGDVVLDVGSGTGLLAFLSLQHGANRVYAVEAGSVIALARQIAQVNGFADRIVWLHGKSTQVTLPEQADVVVSETIGNFGVDEGIVGWMQDASQRHLKPGGRVIPQALTLWTAPVEHAEGYRRVEAWDAGVVGLHYAPARELATNFLHFVAFGRDALLAPPQSWASVSLPEASPQAIAGGVSFVCSRQGTLHGIGGWFEADLGAGITLSNSPESSTTSWSQIFLPLRRPLNVLPGDRVEVKLAAHVNGSLWRWQLRCTRPSADGSVLLGAYSHDSLAGQLLSAQMLRPRRVDSVPVLSQEGEVTRYVLEQMDGQTALGEIAHRLATHFPERFARWEEALARAGAVAAYYASPAS